MRECIEKKPGSELNPAGSLSRPKYTSAFRKLLHLI